MKIKLSRLPLVFLMSVSLFIQLFFSMNVKAQEFQWYVPGAEECAAPVSVLPANLNVDPATLERIQSLIPVYQKHAQRLGFPWQILAAKHYRETGLRLYNPSNGQGIWQLYTLVVTQRQYTFPPAESISVEEFDRQTGIMVDWYFQGERLEQARRHTLLDLQKLFVAYNGWGEVARTLAFYNARRAGVTVDRNNADALLNWNAYAMNQYDADHQNMIAKVSDAGISVAAAESAAQSIIDTGQSNNPIISTNGAIGAVPFYVQLDGPISDLGTGSGGESGDGTVFNSNTGGRYYFIGDSLTVGMEQYLTTLIGSSLAAPIEATSGINIQNSIPLVNFPTTTTDVVIGLGTNNFSATADSFRDLVNQMRNRVYSIKSDVNIHWINIYAPRSDIAANAPNLNAVLDEFTNSESGTYDTNFRVINWASEAVTGGYTFPDELHPREYDERAQFVVNSLGGAGSAAGGSGDSSGCSDRPGGPGAVEGSIVDTALNFSWYEADKVAEIRSVMNNGDSICSMRGTNPGPGRCGQLSRQAGALIGEADAKPAYVTAVKQYNQGNDSDGANWAYSDCGVFVATVMRASGADPSYAARGTSVQMNYVRNSDLYEIIPFTDTALLQPGDVLIKDGHTRVYIGDNQLGSFNVAEASWGNHVPATLYNATVNFSNRNENGGSEYIIARLR